MRTTTSLLLLLVLAACSDAGGPSHLTPARFAIVAGAAQTDTVARELKELVALQVIATDGIQTVPNYPINWTALDGGSVFATVVYSGTDGIARQRWTLGPGARTQRLIARALDPQTGAVLVDDTVTAIAVPEAAIRVTLSRGGFGAIPAGNSLPAEIQYTDRFGNRASCADGGSWQRLTWVSLDSTIAMPTGQGFEDTQGRRLWLVRGITAGETTIRVTANCIPWTDGTTFSVTP